MKKIYSVTCKKYKKFKNRKMSYIHYKTLLRPSIRDKYGSESEKNV